MAGCPDNQLREPQTHVWVTWIDNLKGRPFVEEGLLLLWWESGPCYLAWTNCQAHKEGVCVNMQRLKRTDRTQQRRANSFLDAPPQIANWCHGLISLNCQFWGQGTCPIMSSIHTSRGDSTQHVHICVVPLLLSFGLWEFLSWIPELGHIYGLRRFKFLLSLLYIFEGSLMFRVSLF